MLHEKTTVPNPSAGADGEQPLSKETNGSISEKLEKSKNRSQELFRKMQEMQSPDYLHTVTLDELFDSVYTGSPPIVEGLLWPGTYLFVGAPKVGKSFMVVQIAYHVSMGMKLWGFPVRQGTVLYLALEDDYKRLQQRLYRMYGTEGTEKLHLSKSTFFMSSSYNLWCQNGARSYKIILYGDTARYMTICGKP